MAVHRLTKEEARRIAVRAQLLDADRPTDLLDVVGHLTFLQLDPTAAIAPSADLVAWTRMGDAYRPEQLTQALEQDRSLYEVRAYIRPTADLGLYLEAMAAWPYASDDKRYSPPPGPIAQQWLEQNDSFRQDVLRRLRESGPLMSRELPDTSVVPWQSSGWTGNRNVTQMLEFLNSRGEIAIAGRSGRQRLWDLAERVYPRVKAVPLAKARRALAERRMRWLGISRPEVIGVGGERYHENVQGEPAEVEGTVGEWVVDPAALGRDFDGRTALLSPFDRLIHDRVSRPGALRLRVLPRDVQAGGQATLGVLRAADPPRGTARRKTRRRRRPEGISAARARDPRGRPLHARAHQGRRAELDGLASWLGLEDVVLPSS